MAYVIGQPCIGVKDTACVDACPTDAIHSKEGASQYYIDPATCIDCDACVPVCPVAAIFPGDQVPADQKKFIAINADFFKGFDKSTSTAYTRTKKEGAPAAGEAQGTPKAPSAAAQQEAVGPVVWTEVAGWKEKWEARKNDPEDRIERDKRYGRVRSVFELPDRYVLRFFLPQKTPNHPFLYRYGLPEEMCSYNFSAEMKGHALWIQGRLTDPKIAKLCGHANSFPDRFYIEYVFKQPVASVSVKPQGRHVVDVVAIKATAEAEVA